MILKKVLKKTALVVGLLSLYATGVSEAMRSQSPADIADQRASHEEMRQSKTCLSLLKEISDSIGANKDDDEIELELNPAAIVSIMYRIACKITDENEFFKRNLAPLCEESMKSHNDLLKKTKLDQKGYRVKRAEYGTLYEHFWEKETKWDKDSPNWKELGCSLILINLIRESSEVYNLLGGRDENLKSLSKEKEESIEDICYRTLEILFSEGGDETKLKDELAAMYKTTELYIDSEQALDYLLLNRAISAQRKELENRIDEKYKRFFTDADESARFELLQIGAASDPKREDETKLPFHWTIEDLEKKYPEKSKDVYAQFRKENLDAEAPEKDEALTAFLNKPENKDLKDKFEEYINPLGYKRWEKGTACTPQTSSMLQQQKQPQGDSKCSSFRSFLY